MSTVPASLRLGVDLGGTKIAAIVLDDQGTVRWEHRRPTPREDYDATLEEIVSVVREAEHAVRARCSVGIGTPGAISPATGLIKNANSTWLNGRPLDADIARALGREVRVANDANCLAISEATDGAGAGAAVVFGVIVGTGTGGGLVVRGRGLTGPNAIAGEWAHNPLPWPDLDETPGPACYCGQRGCIETFVSGPGLAADYRRRGGDALDGAAIVIRANGGEPLAALTLGTWTRRLAKALASVINIVDPDVIVMGGGLSRIMTIYDQVPALWPAWVFSDTVRTRFRAARYGDASGVRGAAWLWKDATAT